MQFACNVVRTFQGLNHRFNTPAGGLSAWWRIETWAREGVYLGSQVPVDAEPGTTGHDPAKPGSPVDRGTFNASKRCENEAFLILLRSDVYEKPIPEGP